MTLKSGIPIENTLPFLVRAPFGVLYSRRFRIIITLVTRVREHALKKHSKQYTRLFAQKTYTRLLRRTYNDNIVYLRCIDRSEKSTLLTIIIINEHVNQSRSNNNIIIVNIHEAEYTLVIYGAG